MPRDPATAPYRTWFLAGITLVGVACTAPTLQDHVTSFVADHNAYRTATLEAVVTAQIRFVDADGTTIDGIEAFSNLLSWDSVTATQWRADGMRVSGNAVVAMRLTVTSAWHQLLGVGNVLHERAAFTFRGGRIAEIALGPLAAESKTKLDRALSGFLAWAQHEYPERLARIRPNGRFDYGSRRAADWLALLQEWRTGTR